MSVKTRLKTLIARLADALTAKGVEASAEETLTALVDKVGDIEIGQWTRPSEWLPYPEFSSEYDEVWLLVKVLPNSGGNARINFLKPLPYTVDWGDGVTEQITALPTLHYYQWEDISRDTETSDGYRQVWCRAWCKRGTLGTFFVGTTYINQFPGYNTVIEIVVNSSSENVTFSQYGDGGQAKLCEHIKVVNPDVPLQIVNITRMTNLQHISGNYRFTGDNPIYYAQCIPCMDLNINYRSFTKSQSFSNCFAHSISADFTDSPTMNQMFSGCSHAVEITVKNTNQAANWSFAFSGCTMLKRINGLDLQSATTLSNIFRYCQSLQFIDGLSTINPNIITSCASIFSSCESIVEVPDLLFSNATDWANAFYGCNSLNCVGTLDLSSATSTRQMFYNVGCLREVRFVEQSIPISLTIGSSILSDASIQSIIDGLKDLTGQTSQTLTLNSSVVSKITDDQAQAISAKNWNIG